MKLTNMQVDALVEKVMTLQKEKKEVLIKQALERNKSTIELEFKHFEQDLKQLDKIPLSNLCYIFNFSSGFRQYLTQEGVNDKIKTLKENFRKSLERKYSVELITKEVFNPLEKSEIKNTIILKSIDSTTVDEILNSFK